MCCFDSDCPIRLDRLPAPPMRALAVCTALLVALAAVLLPTRAFAWCDLSINDTPVAPGDLGPGWSYPAEGQLELNGYAGGPITCFGDLTVTLAGTNSAADSVDGASHASTAALEVWGSLVVRGTGTLTATGAQHGVFVMDTLTVQQATLTCVATGDGIEDELVAGLRAGSAVLADGASVEARAQRAPASPDAAAVGAYLGNAGAAKSADAAAALSINASTLVAAGPTAGVLANGIALTDARVTVPAEGRVADPSDHPSGMQSTVCEAGEARDGADTQVTPATEVHIEPYTAPDPTPTDPEPAAPAQDPADAPSQPEPTTAGAATTNTIVTNVTTAKRVKKTASKANDSALPRTGDANNGCLAASVALATAGCVFVTLAALATKRGRKA